MKSTAQSTSEKTANDNPYAGANFPTPGQIAQAQSVGGPANPEALKLLALLGLGGLGIGAGARSIRGLLDIAKKPTELETTLGGPSPVVVSLKKRRRLKAAGFKEFFLGQQTGGEGSFFPGYAAKPYMLPAGGALGLGGIYGGYKLINSMLRRNEEQERKRRVTEAKKLYQKALLSEFEQAGMTAKGASARTFEEDLDLLASRIVESGHIKNAQLKDWLGTGLGAYLLGAGTLAGLGGLTTYMATKSQDPAEKVRKALKARQRQRWASRPPEIYFVHKDEAMPRLRDDEKIGSLIRSGAIAHFYK